jgi:hypothetical protein
MPVTRTLLASCLALLALLPWAVRAETALAALDLQRRAPPPPERELDCLALNIYWEARSESLLGRMAVAAVTLNRVAAPAFPDTVCDVVFQGEERGRNLCQFSRRCDGRGDQPRNLVAWQEARRVARLALSRGVEDPTGGALWYHADHVLPSWAREMALLAKIGHHVFYGRNAPAAEPAQRAGGPMTKLAAMTQELFKSLMGELRIDSAQDPATGLLLCDDAALCDQARPRAQAVRAAPSSSFDDDKMLLEPDLSAATGPPIPARKRAGIPIS